MTKETTMTLPDGFVPHDGLGCPITSPPGGIYIMLRCGVMGWATNEARAWNWDIRQGTFAGTSTCYLKDTDIIAYRIENTA